MTIKLGKFDEWLRTSAGVKSQNQHKLKPEVIKYLIDKIVENQSAKREDVA